MSYLAYIRFKSKLYCICMSIDYAWGVNPLDMPRTPYWASEGKHLQQHVRLRINLVKNKFCPVMSVHPVAKNTLFQNSLCFLINFSSHEKPFTLLFHSNFVN